MTIQLIYQPKMFESSQAIYEYLGEVENEEFPEASFLGKDPLIISRNLKQAANYLRLNMIFTIISFIILNGLIWSFTHKLFKKMKTREFLYNYLNFGIVSLIFFAVMVFVSQIIIKVSFKTFVMEGQILPLYIVLILILLILSHFMLIIFTILKHDNLLETIKKGLKLGVTKIHKILLIYLFMLIIYAIVFFLIYFAFNTHFVILAIALLLLPLTTVLNRIFFISKMRELEKSA